MDNQLIISGRRPDLYWSEPDVSRLLADTYPQQALSTIRQLFTLCGEAQYLAAHLLLLPDSRQDVIDAAINRTQQELIFETLRRLLTDWLPAFAGRKASASEWQLLRQRQYQSLAQTLIFAGPVADWLQGGVAHWQCWLTEQNSEMAGWIASLWQQQVPDLPLISEADERLLEQSAADISPLAVHHYLLHEMGGQPVALRLLARCIALARAMTMPDSLRWRRFSACGWHVAAVETARGWLTHQLRWCDADSNNTDSNNENSDNRAEYHKECENKESVNDDHEDNSSGLPPRCIASYRIIPPTRRHSLQNGLIQQTLAALPPAQWRRHLLLLDPCVAFSIT